MVSEHKEKQEELNQTLEFQKESLHISVKCKSRFPLGN